MNRMEKRELQKKKYVKIILYTLVIYLITSSLVFCKIVLDENKQIREEINNDPSIPLETKKELGLR